MIMKKTLYSKTVAVLICAGIFCLNAAFAVPRGRQELVPSGHWIYDALTAISLENSLVNFSDNAPLTVAEIESYMDEIDYTKLSPSGRKQWNRINDYLREQNWSFNSGKLSVGIDPTFNPEAYYKTNDDIDWQYDRYQRNALIDVPVTFSAGDWLTMGCDFHLAQNQGEMLHDDDYCNIPLSSDQFDVNFPKTGYISTGYQFGEASGFSFQLGSGSQSIGRTETGSCIVSDYMTGASYGQLSFYSPNIRYVFTATELNVDKYMYMHRVSFRFAKKLTLSVMEATLTNASLELRYLNPFTVFHGMAPWRDYGSDDSHNGEYLGLSLNYVPFSYLRLYGLFVMDQYQVPYETDNWPDSLTPNAMGGQLGLESYIPARDGYLHFVLEGYYAQPCLYIKQSPDWSFVRTYTDNIGDNAIFYEWVGSPFGPDTIAGELTAGYEMPGKWSVDLTYLFMVQGENAEKSIFGTWSSTDGGDTESSWSSTWPYPTSANGRNIYAMTPTGTPKYTNRLSVRGTWHANDWLSFTLQPAYVIIFNNTNSSGTRIVGNTDWGVECAFAVQCQLTKIRKTTGA
jgi:hypothetical protein